MRTPQNESYPVPPPGYQTAIPFQYPKIKLQIAAVGLLVITTPALIVITWLLQGRPASFTFILDGFLELVLVLVVVVATIVLHELVHGLTYQLLGYRVTYGVSIHLLAAYAGAFKQWQKRNHNILVALAPLVGLTPWLLWLLSLPQPIVVLLAFAALLFNIGGAVGDIYLAWRLLRLPRDTLLYDIDASTMLIFIPSCSQ